MSTESRLIKFARPAIIWSGLILLTLTDVIIPTASLFWRPEPLKLTLDPNFWNAWTFCVSIYVGGRSFEKIGGFKKKGSPENPG